MRRYARTLSSLALVALAASGAPACSLGLGDSGTVNTELSSDPATDPRTSDAPGTIIVHPARVPVVGSPGYYERLERFTRLPSPPSAPLASRLVVREFPKVPAGPDSRYGKAAAASAPASATGTSPPDPSPVRWQVAPEVPMAMAAKASPESPALQPPSAPGKGAIAVIPFTSQSPNLTDTTRKQLDEVAKRITDMRLRQVELRGFAAAGDPDNRKIALARALVVRSYLLDRGVKARLEVGSFNGEGEHVEILVPGT